MKGEIRFCKRGKLIPRYVGPYKILKRVGKVAFKLELPAELASVHPAFTQVYGSSIHSAIIECGCESNLSYKDVPVKILDCQVRNLRNKDVASVKVYGGVSP